MLENARNARKYENSNKVKLNASKFFPNKGDFYDF